MFVFPAYVGMSPLMGGIVDDYEGVPRIRGDEPRTICSRCFMVLCSPHTWG